MSYSPGFESKLRNILAKVGRVKRYSEEANNGFENTVDSQSGRKKNYGSVISKYSPVNFSYSLIIYLRVIIIHLTIALNIYLFAVSK